MRCCASGGPGYHTRSLLLSAPPDTDTSYRSCRQSAPLARMLDEPGSGRIYLEQTIRDSLDIADNRGYGRHRLRNFRFARPIHPMSFAIAVWSIICATPEVLIVRRLPTWRRR